MRDNVSLANNFCHSLSYQVDSLRSETIKTKNSDICQSSQIEICYGREESVEKGTEPRDNSAITENGSGEDKVGINLRNSNETIEEGMEASDLFWGDVTSRAQALSVPTSFRPIKTKHRTFK